MLPKYTLPIKALNDLRTVAHSQLLRLLDLFGVLITLFELCHVILLNSERVVLEEGLPVPRFSCTMFHLLVV